MTHVVEKRKGYWSYLSGKNEEEQTEYKKTIIKLPLLEQTKAVVLNER